MKAEDVLYITLYIQIRVLTTGEYNEYAGGVVMLIGSEREIRLAISN